jgi:hypothetical protein
MASAYTLDQLREDVGRQYAPMEITAGRSKFVLTNLLRLSKEKRAAAQAAVAKINEDGEDGEDQFENVLSALGELLLIVVDNDKGQQLVDEIGDDLPLGMHIVKLWSERTQPGEAQS